MPIQPQHSTAVVEIKTVNLLPTAWTSATAHYAAVEEAAVYGGFQNE